MEHATHALHFETHLATPRSKKTLESLPTSGSQCLHTSSAASFARKPSNRKMVPQHPISRAPGARSLKILLKCSARWSASQVPKILPCFAKVECGIMFRSAQVSLMRKASLPFQNSHHDLPAAHYRLLFKMERHSAGPHWPPALHEGNCVCLLCIVDTLIHATQASSTISSANVPKLSRHANPSKRIERRVLGL